MTMDIKQLNMDLVNLKKMRDDNLISESEHARLKELLINPPPPPPVDTSKDETEPLADYLAGENKKRHQKWRVPFEEFSLFEKGWMEESLERKQETFRSLAREGMTSPIEVMIATYVLFGKPEDLRFLQSLLVNASDSKRIEYHNWYVARRWGDAFLQQHGSSITSLNQPLFPFDEAFGPQNVRIFRQQENLEGGNPERAPEKCSIFNPGTTNRTHKEESTNKTIFASGYPVQVIDGFVDLGIVEDAIGWLQGRISDLENAMRTAKVEPPQPSTPQPARSTQRGNNHYPRGGRGTGRGYNNYNNYNNNQYYQRGRGGRGQGNY
jgi:hypothetical protein